MVMFDIVEEILLRLPVKHLLLSKSICKSWYSLISSPSFIKTHVKLICNKEGNNKRKIAKLTSYQDVDESEPRYRIPPEWKLYDCWVIQGSSNGLVLYTGPRISVTNPVTREFRELQLLPPRAPKETECFGFGYDSSTDDYKVVMAICKQGKTLVRILSLNSNTWKLFGQIEYKFDDIWLQKPGILFNSALHWFWLDAANEKPLIVSFNLAKEEFTEIPQPDDTRYVWNLGCSLGIMDGRLCIFPYFDDDDDFPSCGTWLIKNYNAKPSWELLSSKDCEMNNHVIHYILNNDASRSRIMPAYSYDENIHLSRSKKYIPSPIFVPTLVSPFVNDNNGGRSHAKNAGSVKEKTEIEEVFSVDDKEEEKEYVIGLLEVEGG